MPEGLSGNKVVQEQQFKPEKTYTWLNDHHEQMIATLRDIVLHESPTHDKTACDELCEHLAGKFAAIGGKVKLHEEPVAGNHLQVDFAGAGRRKPVLLLGHLDTVYAMGALQTMPWRESEGRLYGPGVFDMKGGIVHMLFALRALREMASELPRSVKVLLVSDEEEGSTTSRAITEEVARQCGAVLVCEPSGPGGALKTARKGVGGFTLTVTGKAAHSGLDFEKGHSAILELSHQIQAISRLTDLERGITFNVGIVSGGTRVNVVSDHATAHMDLRVAHRDQGAEMEQRLRALRPINPNCKLEVAGGINRPPLERTEDVAKLFQLAKEIAQKLGFELHETAVGGGSDGNFTAGIGLPTLDGLGAVGDGAHARHEHVIAAELPRRAALLAGLIQTVE